MSEGLERAQQGLLNSDDAEVWATEFCRIFQGHIIVLDTADDTTVVGSMLDVGTMTGWFANAMQTAINVSKARDEIHANEAPIGMVPEAQREAFVEGAEEGRQERRTTDLDDPTA